VCPDKEATQSNSAHKFLREQSIRNASGKKWGLQKKGYRDENRATMIKYQPENYKASWEGVPMSNSKRPVNSNQRKKKVKQHRREHGFRKHNKPRKQTQSTLLLTRVEAPVEVGEKEPRGMLRRVRDAGSRKNKGEGNL